MRAFRIVSVASLGAVLLVGCGSSSSSDSKTLNGKTLAATYASVVCEAAAKCQCTDGSAVSDCKAAMNERYLEELSNVLDYNPAWKVDPALAQTCLDDMKAILNTCEGPVKSGPGGHYTWPESCVGNGDYPSAFFVGTQAEGEKCRNDEGDRGDCAPGLVCNYQTQTCVAAVAKDGDCRWADCAKGLVCLGGYDSEENYVYTCTERLAKDAECNPEGGTPCVEGLRCLTADDGATFTCRASRSLAAGATCDYISDYTAKCSDGQFCDRDSIDGSTPTMKCTAFLADGEKCNQDRQCQHGWCNTNFDKASEYVCADPGVCEILTVSIMGND